MLGRSSSGELGGRRPDARFAVRVVSALLAVGLAVQAVRLVLILVEPVDATAPRGLSVTLPNPARASLSGVDPFFRNDGVAGAVAASDDAAAGELVLYGVRSGGGRSAAILAGLDGVQRSYATGEEVAPGVVLQSVGLDHVILSRSGATSRLGFPKLTPASAVATSAPAVLSSTPSTAASAPASTGSPGGNAAAVFEREATLRPNLVDRRVRGYVLTLRGDGVLSRAGLKTGDVLLSVNGTVLEPESLNALPAELAARPDVAVAYERDGKPGSLVVPPPS